MSDILERLAKSSMRDWKDALHRRCWDAAAEISRLRTQVSTLQANEATYERILGPCSPQEVSDVVKVLRDKVAALQARVEAGDRLRDEVDSFRVGLDGKGPAFDAIKYYLQEATAASKSEVTK